MSNKTVEYQGVMPTVSLGSALRPAEFASMVGVTRQSINTAIKSGRIKKNSDGMVDIEDPVNLKYIMKRNKVDLSGKIDLQRPVKLQPTKEVVKTKEIQTVVVKEKNVPINIEPGRDPLEYLDEDELDRLKRIEDIKTKRIKNAASRFELVERQLVKVVMGKIHTVDTQELLTLPAKMAPLICGMCGVEDPEKIREAEVAIETEVYTALQNIQNIISEFLETVEDSFDFEGKGKKEHSI
jgi:hypothetical protein